MGGRASVLITRPAGQADSLCSALQARGFDTHQQPFLELCPLPALAPADRQQLYNLDQFGHIIFISGNAVRFGMEEIESHCRSYRWALTGMRLAPRQPACWLATELWRSRPRMK